MEAVYRGIGVIAYRDVLRFKQERGRPIAAFGFPLLYLLIFGAGFNRAIGALAPGVDYLTFLFPGIISMTVLQTALAAGTSVVWEVMLALAPLLGVSLNWALVAKLVPLVITLSLWLSGLGILLSAWIRSNVTYGAVMQFAAFPLIFTAGVFFPLRDVPAWLRVIATLNPATYGVDAVRQAFLGADGAALGLTVLGHRMSIVEDCAVVLCVSAVAMVAAVWSFNYQEGRS
jgi:ABC-2 type transport system permease protein